MKRVKCSDCVEHHAVHRRVSHKPGKHPMYVRELVLVRGGRQTYLSAHRGDGAQAIVRGPATLRALAEAILAELDQPKRKRAKR